MRSYAIFSTAFLAVLNLVSALPTPQDTAIGEANPQDEAAAQAVIATPKPPPFPDSYNETTCQLDAKIDNYSIVNSTHGLPKRDVTSMGGAGAQLDPRQLDARGCRIISQAQNHWYSLPNHGMDAIEFTPAVAGLSYTIGWSFNIISPTNLVVYKGTDVYKKFSLVPNAATREKQNFKLGDLGTYHFQLIVDDQDSKVRDAGHIRLYSATTASIIQ